jgi:hypothetical protein
MDYQEPPAVRHTRMKKTFYNAAKHSTRINKRAVQSSIDIGKEKTQYFEKVSLGCGGTVALIVSFLGAHAGRLQPRWLLRSALVTLVLAMMLGFFRNWLFPWYAFGVWQVQDLDAQVKRERARRDLIAAELTFAAEDGQPIDPQTWIADFQYREVVYDAKIEELKKARDRWFNWTKYTEQLTLVLASLGIVLLVALAWWNF